MRTKNISRYKGTNNTQSSLVMQLINEIIQSMNVRPSAISTYQ